MNQRILMLIFLYASFLLGMASDYDAKQEALISKIEQNLKQNNYSPERREDGLKFISEGDTYYIEVTPEDHDPMYVRLCRYVKFDNKVNRENVMEEISSLNTTYGVKTYCKEKNVIIVAEMYVTSANQFNDVFNELLNQVKRAYKKID